MKKDKSVRKAELKAAAVRQLKSLIGPVIILLIILVGVLVITFYHEKEEPAEIIEVNSYSGDKKSFKLENENLVFELDPKSTQFTVTEKKNGGVWYSNPQDADKDPLALKLEKEKLKSTLLLTYSTINGVDTLFNNYAYSMANGIFDIEEGEDYIKVLYSIGDMEKEYVIPTVMEAERFEELLSNMDKGDVSRVTEYYKKYDINNLGKKDNREELLEKYPQLETSVIYTLRDKTKDNIKVKLEEYFGAAGYTYEEYLEGKSDGEGGASSEKPVFNINVIYRLEGNDLIVEIPFDEIEFRSAYPIYYLSVLPYFGAGSTEEEGYLMVPEGGGALIDFNNGKTAQNSYFANLYGWDYALRREAVVHETEVYFNAFGIAREDSSFLCILEDGAPYAGVAADISGKMNSYNYVYPQYNLIHREKFEMGDRAAAAVYVYEKALPSGEKIKQRYRFIDSGDYVDMAEAYREYLMEQFPDSFTENSDEAVPVALEIVGAIDKVKQILGVPVSRPLELTTFSEAQEILKKLTEEGMSNLSVKLSGWMNGGVQQKLLKKVKLVSSLGSSKKLKSLVDYASENEIDFYLDGITNFAYDSDLLDGFFGMRDAARFINRDQAKIYPYSTVTYAARERQDPHYLLKSSLINKMVDNLVAATDTYGTGVSFQDVGMLLSSDFNRKAVVTRQAAMESQIGQIKSIEETGKKIMMNMGNNYMVGYCDFVTNMDLSGSLYTIIDRAVPIYQMALHGYINYAGEPLNLTQNKEQILLESAEYGAGLAFTVMDETAFTLQDTLYTEYFGAEFDAWEAEMISIWKRYNEELGHTFCQKMTGHEKLTATLSCTEYEDGTKVYVNYGLDTVKTPEGKDVAAREYLVVRQDTETKKD